MKPAYYLFALGLCLTGTALSSELKKAAELPLPAALRNQAMIKLATVKIDEPRPLLPLRAGEKLYGNGSYVWKVIPAEFAGFRFAQALDKHGAVTSFTVETEGLVYVAFTSRWMLEDHEKARDGLVSRRQMIRDGWKPLGEKSVLVSDEVDYNWQVFARNCKAKEKMTLRTEKYCPPMVLVR